MSAISQSAISHSAPSTVGGLAPIMAVVSVAFLVIGMALPVLPLHVHQDLGLGPFAVGLVAGSQFVASLLSRVWAGRDADGRGAKHAVLAGLVAASVAGLVYLLSLRFVAQPMVSAAILLLGRALLGGAESFIITGGVSWGLSLAGPANAGRVIAWVGMAMFAALALGGPFGTALYQAGGFAAIALATTLIPLATVGLVMPLAAIRPAGGARASIFSVLGSVWLPGIGSACSSIGFGAMIAFSVLLSAERQWSPSWLLFSLFAAALVVARALLGHLPDRLGGARVALVSVLIEALGLALIGVVRGQTVAAAGAVLVGSGFALVYPGLGVEAVRRAPAQSRGLAMGAYTAFLDVALGFGSPALGLVAGAAELGSVFLVGMLVVLGGAAVPVTLLWNRAPAGVCA